MEFDFFSLPMGAGPRDPVVGRDEFGNPVYQDRLGQQYSAGYSYGQPPPQPAPGRNALLDLPLGADDLRAQRGFGRSAYLDGLVNAPAAAANDTAPTRFDRASAGAVNALASGVVQGLTAPGRAAQGEPVTYGDTWATALDYGLMGAPMAAPEGAIRANSFRAGSGAGTSSLSSDRMSDIFSKADDLAARLRERYGDSVEITRHPTSYGNSAYIRVRAPSEDGRAWVGGGVRLSDHDIGEFRRATDELPTVIDGSDISVDSLFEQIDNQLSRGLESVNAQASARAVRSQAAAAWDQLSERDRRRYYKMAFGLPGGREAAGRQIFIDEWLSQK